MLDDTDTREAPAALARLRVNTMAVPAVPVDAVHALWSRGTDPLLWDPPAGLRAAASGASVRLTASGPQRMVNLRETAARLWRTVAHEVSGDAPAPRLWGGFAFAPGAAREDGWQAFGDASFVLPRLTYWTDGHRGWLQSVGREGDDTLDDDAVDAQHEIARLAKAGLAEAGLAGRTLADGAFADGALADGALADDALGDAARADAGGAGAVPACEIALADAAAWRGQVDEILRAIGAARVRKVVAARRAQVTFERAPSVVGVLAALRGETGPVWRFAIARGGATFLGATPELLVRRHDDRIETCALAGTLAKAAGGGEDLLASAKDRDEHAFVRDGIVEALAPLCGELQVPEAPAVRALSRLYHLATPIRGRLARRTHVLDLCERLHPTPATCGTPRDAALQMILATEPAPRGWYAAPLGWFDASGDGEFVVGLRAGLLDGRRAYVHAGAGIVAGSRAERELDEVQLKLRVLLHALGLADA